MNKPFLAALLAATALNGCATLNSPQTCQRALTGLSAASDIAAVLVRYGYAPEAAAKAAEAIAAAQLAVSVACATSSAQ